MKELLIIFLVMILIVGCSNFEEDVINFNNRLRGINSENKEKIENDTTPTKEDIYELLRDGKKMTISKR